MVENTTINDSISMMNISKPKVNLNTTSKNNNYSKPISDRAKNVLLPS